MNYVYDLISKAFINLASILPDSLRELHISLASSLFITFDWLIVFVCVYRNSPFKLKSLVCTISNANSRLSNGRRRWRLSNSSDRCSPLFRIFPFTFQMIKESIFSFQHIVLCNTSHIEKNIRVLTSNTNTQSTPLNVFSQSKWFCWSFRIRQSRFNDCNVSLLI